MARLVRFRCGQAEGDNPHSSGAISQLQSLPQRQAAPRRFGFRSIDEGQMAKAGAIARIRERLLNVEGTPETHDPGS
jgi:hypothetical protein